MGYKITFKDGKEENFDGYDEHEFGDVFLELSDSDYDSEDDKGKSSVYIAMDSIARLE